MQRFQLPNDTVSTTAKQIEETVNLKDPEDAIKYFPSLFVRKRNDGDNQAVLATRTWGLNSSARTLIYEDDLLVSALIGNNNSGASPHWNLIVPEAIARIDFLNGPYAAMYPGNSMGGVLLVTTKMPDKFEADIKQTVSIQPWHQYDTKNTYADTVTSMFVGNRNGRLSWFVAANFLDGYQQPLTYTTVSAPPAGTSGTIAALNKQGVVADVVGTGALIHTQQTSANFKAAYDLLPTVQATYSLGIWNNVQTSNPQSYLTSTATGAADTRRRLELRQQRIYLEPDAHEQRGVAQERHQRRFRFRPFGVELQLPPRHHAQPVYGDSDRVRLFAERQDHPQRRHQLAERRRQGHLAAGWLRRSAGDQLRHSRRPLLFHNPVYGSSVWNEASSVTGQTYSDGIGETRTGALWAQDAWRFAPMWKLTVGGRLETWQALDGFNINTVATGAGVITSTTAVNQPGLSATNFSPKASLSFEPNKDWNVTANFGEAYRYPTVTELYQNVTVNGVATFANPFLTPEQDLNGELNIERKWTDGRVALHRVR